MSGNGFSTRRQKNGGSFRSNVSLTQFCVIPDVLVMKETNKVTFSTGK
jgi:hypothetical protein